MFSRRRVSLVFLLPLIGVLLLLPALGQESDSKTSVLASNPPAVEDPEMLDEDRIEEWYCEIYFFCSDEEDELTGDGDYIDGTGESCESCVASAAPGCDDADCYGAVKHCCVDDPATDEICIREGGTVPYCDGPEMVKSMRRKYGYRGREFSIVEPMPRTRYEFHAIGRDTLLPISMASTRREFAWRVFRSIAEGHGGILSGSLRTREVPALIHKCYVRVRSEFESTIFDQEVEGVGMTAIQAAAAAFDAADLYAQYLREVENHRDVRVLTSVRSVRLINSLENACVASKLCRHVCETVNEDRTIQTTRFAKSYRAACRGAQAAAIVLADPFGGTIPGSCHNLPTVIPENAREADSDCVGCGSDSADPSGETSADTK